MAGDRAVAGHEFAKPLRHEPVARPVKPKAPHAVPLHPVGRHRVQGILLGDRGVEPRLKRRHQRHARHPLPEQPHRPHVGRVVGRGDGGHFLHGGEDIGIDPHDTAHAAAVHRLEAHRRHLVHARERAALGRELRERRLDCHRVVGHGHDTLHSPAVGRRIDAAFGRPDPLDAAPRQLPLRAGIGRPFRQVEEPVFEARGSEIGDQNLHVVFLVCSCLRSHPTAAPGGDAR